MKSVNGENTEKLERQILATIAYYDILNYPLTSFEVFLYLINNRRRYCEMSLLWSIKLSEIIELLDNSEYLKKYIGQKLGFYFLRKNPPNPPYQGGDADIVQRRLDGRKISDGKWKKARKIYKIMRAVPFLRGILISGSLALGSVKKSSDIDIMVIAKNGRIWTVRFFLMILIFFLGARRNEKDTKDKICLNHYITDKSLQIPFFSLYDAHLYSHLINVYDDKDNIKTFQEFQKNNSWIKNYVQNYDLSELRFSTSVKKNKTLSFIAKILEFILSGKAGDYFEKTLSKIQIAKIKKNPSFNNKDGRITISGDQLEFHPKLHEKVIIPEFNKRMKNLGLLEFTNQKESDGLEL
jgi:hypothetical protein